MFECSDNFDFPERHFASPKHYMIHSIKLTKEWTICKFCARQNKLNDYLANFPPFGQNQQISNEQTVNMIHATLPKAWKSEMVQNDFDPNDHMTVNF